MQDDGSWFSVALFLAICGIVLGLGYYRANYAPCPEGQHNATIVTEINRNTGEIIETRRICVYDCQVPTGADYDEWQKKYDCINMTWVEK